MKKAENIFNTRIKYIAFILLAITGVLFLTAAFGSPEALIMPAVGALAWIVKGEFKALTDDEIKELSVDEMAGYYNALNAHKQKELEGKIESKVGKEEIEKFMKEFSESKDNQMKAMNEILKLQGLEIQKFKTKSIEKPLDKGAFKKALGKVAEELKGQRKLPEQIKSEDGKLFTKTVGTMSFTNSVTGTIPQADRDPGFNDFVKQEFTIRSLSDVGTTSANLKEWVYKTAKEGSAAMTAEGAAKSQVDWTYVVSNASVKKITAFIKITKEMLDDIDGIMSDINGELMYEIDLVEETQLIEGVGTTIYLNGIEKYARPLDNTGLAGTIATPNKWDVLGAAITQIRLEMQKKGKANAIFLNPADLFALVYGSRTTTNAYNAPLAVVNPNGTLIHGIPVIESDSITAGKFLVADMTKFHIRDREGLSIAMGYDSDDWTKNLVTILAEKRLVSYVKENDYAAFVTDTFTDGITFLTAST